MSIYLDERNPGKHAPFEDAAPDIVEYVRYLEVIAGKSANTAFSYYCDLRSFSRVCNILSEYGTKTRSEYASEAFYAEHYEVITRDRALQVLKNI